MWSDLNCFPTLIEITHNMISLEQSSKRNRWFEEKITKVSRVPEEKWKIKQKHYRDESYIDSNKNRMTLTENNDLAA